MISGVVEDVLHSAPRSKAAASLNASSGTSSRDQPRTDACRRGNRAVKSWSSIATLSAASSEVRPRSFCIMQRVVIQARVEVAEQPPSQRVERNPSGRRVP